MDSMEFERLIKKYMDFLVTEFYFSSQQMDYQYMEKYYISDKTGIRLVLDGGNVEMQIGRITNPTREWHEFVDIMRYFAPEINDVNMFVPTLTTLLVDNQLNQMALWMKAYCHPLLIGDFSMEMEILKVKRQRIKDNIKRQKQIQKQTRNRLKVRSLFRMNRGKK
jgi:predicted DNA-binding protein YlxM (UPF0122 family)